MAINIGAGAMEPAKPELFRLPWIVGLLSGAWLRDPYRRNGRRALRDFRQLAVSSGINKEVLPGGTPL